jgi:excisionase family DNA binding protein
MILDAAAMKFRHPMLSGDGGDDGAPGDRDDVLLNSSEVAAILDLSPDTVNEFARKSILPGFKKGRQWRFRKRDVASYKRQLRGTTAA